MAGDICRTMETKAKKTTRPHRLHIRISDEEKMLLERATPRNRKGPKKVSVHARKILFNALRPEARV